jgi:hypothetical protein
MIFLPMVACVDGTTFDERFSKMKKQYNAKHKNLLIQALQQHVVREPLFAKTEPESTFWQRFMSGFIEMLPVEGQRSSAQPTG